MIREGNTCIISLASDSWSIPLFRSNKVEQHSYHQLFSSNMFTQDQDWIHVFKTSHQGDGNVTKLAECLTSIEEVLGYRSSTAQNQAWMFLLEITVLME